VISEHLWNEIRQNYEEGRYSAALLDAVHHLSAIIREKGNLEGDGAQLVGDAFGGLSPRIKVNKLQTENDKNVQRGVEALLRGIYQAIRNPRSHEKITDSNQDADAVIVFIDYLIRLIGASKSQFSMSDYLSRVFDDSFVASRQYADLLVGEIPLNKRMDVMLNVLKKKEEGDCSKIHFFFNSLLAVMDTSQQAEIYQLLSDELKSIESENGIINIIQLLNPSDWTKIEMVARLRIENKVNASIRDGTYNVILEKCNSGVLGTWARGLFPFFSLKNEAYSAVMDRLFSGVKGPEEYALRFLAYGLPTLREKPIPPLQAQIRAKLKAGHEGFFNLIKSFGRPGTQEWRKPFAEDLAAFVPVDNVTPPDADEVPF